MTRIYPRGAGPARSREIVQAAVVAGLLAATAMGLFAMIRSTAEGLGFWLPMKLITGIYFGVEALLGDAGTILLGMLTHLVVGVAWALPFTFVIRRPFGGWSIPLGVLYGILVWAIMTYLVLPWANELMYERVQVAPGWWFAYHLLYGLVLGLAPFIAERLHRSHSAVV